MSVKISPKITDLGKSCRFLLSALRRQGSRVHQLLVGLTEPHRQEGDAAPGFLDSIVAFGRRLEASMASLFGAEGSVVDAEVRLTLLREQRDNLVALLAQAIVRLRRKILSRYVSPNLVALSLFSPRFRVPDPLLRQSDAIDAAFARDDLTLLLGPLADGEEAETPPSTAPARRIADELRTALTSLDNARRDLDVAIDEKNKLLAEHEELFVYTARTFEAQCVLAGLRKLAAKVRPSERSPGRTEQEVEAEQRQAASEETAEETPTPEGTPEIGDDEPRTSESA